MNCDPQYQAPAAAIDRRDCLRAVIGAVMTACMLDFDRLLSWHEPDLEQWLRSLGAHAIGDAALLRRLGAGYLTAHPEERDHAYLTRLLSGRLLSGAQTRPQVSSLSESVARDWRAHDVALLDGWLFARTEARVCALLHLMQGAAA